MQTRHTNRSFILIPRVKSFEIRRPEAGKSTLRTKPTERAWFVVPAMTVLEMLRAELFPRTFIGSPSTGSIML